MHKYIGGYAPYIHKLIYDLDQREVVFLFEELAIELPSRMQLKFLDVLSFEETTFEEAFDNNFTDSVMGIHKVSDGIYCVNTEKRELIIKVGREPVSAAI